MHVTEAGRRAMRSFNRGLCFIVQEPSGNSPVSMRVVLLRKPHVVAHRLRLGQAGQADVGFRPGEPAQVVLERRWFVEVHTGDLEASDLEEKRLLLLTAHGCP